MSAADVEHDGPRESPESREKLTLANSIAAAAVNLTLPDLRVLAWIVRQLPGEKLRAACEEVTARGWCSSSETRVVVRTTPEEHARASLLSLVRQAARVVIGRDHPPHRTREEVLRDEAERRVAALTKPGGAP